MKRTFNEIHIRMVTHEEYEKLMRLCHNLTYEAKKRDDIEYLNKMLEEYYAIRDYFYSLHSDEYWYKRLDGMSDEEFLKEKIKIIHFPNYQNIPNKMVLGRVVRNVKLIDYTVYAGYNLAFKNSCVLKANDLDIKKKKIANKMSWIGEVEEKEGKPLSKIPVEDFCKYFYSERIATAGFERSEFLWCVKGLLKHDGMTETEIEEYTDTYIKHVVKEVAERSNAELESSQTLYGEINKVLGTVYSRGKSFKYRFTNARDQVIICLILLGVTVDEFQYLDEKDFNSKDFNDNGVLTIRNPKMGTRTIEIPLSLKLKMNEYLGMVHTKSSDGSLIVGVRAVNDEYVQITERQVRVAVMKYDDKMKKATDLTQIGRMLNFMDIVREYEEKHGKKPKGDYFEDKENLDLITNNMRRYGMLHADGFITVDDMKFIQLQYHKFYANYLGTRVH